jgi:hypothetical protein
MRLSRFLPLLLALWWPATLFFGGNIGWWNDDYFFCGRDPDSGSIRFLVQTAANPFTQAQPFQVWRPLNFLFTTSLITFFWENPWVVHAIGALTHLAAGLLLWRVLTRLGLSPQACVWGVLVLLCTPIGFEAIHWASAIATAVSICLLLATIDLYIRYTKRELSGVGVVALVVLGIAIPLVNEQPAACLAALPLLFFAIRPEDEPLARSCVRAILPLVPIAVCHGAYVLLIAKALPPTSYGSANSFASLHDLPHRFGVIWAQMYREFAFHTLGLGALFEGVRALVTHWPLTLLAAAGLFVGLARGRSAWFEATESPLRSRSLRTRAWMLAFAIATYWLMLFPLAACLFVHVRPRMTYPATAALAILLALIGGELRDAFVSRSQSRARPRDEAGNGDSSAPRHRVLTAYHAVTGILIVALAIAGVVMLIGVQSGYRARHAADLSSARALHALYPSVPPGTVFLPMLVNNHPIQTGALRFDSYFCSAWNWSYAYPTLIQREYQRGDIIGAMGDPNFTLITPTSDDEYLFGAPLLPDIPRDPTTGKARFAWSSTITFEVGARGEITLLSPLTLERDGDAIAHVRPPLVESLRGHPGVTIRPFTQRVP